MIKKKKTKWNKKSFYWERDVFKPPQKSKIKKKKKKKKKAIIYKEHDFGIHFRNEKNF